MKVRLFFLLVVLGVLTVSCSKDDNSDPVGTVSVNMMNEDNGKTALGNSDVYINEANNFYSTSCSINQFGKKGGLGSISTPVLKGLSSQVAVEPGNAYQVFKDAAIREFPSGKLALNISADYYNVYVVSQIMQGDTVMGAKVNFALMDVPDYGLPEYDSEIGVLDEGIGDELTINLPTSDFEYESDTDYKNLLEFRKEGNKLIVRLYMSVTLNHTFSFYIRASEGYTYVHGEVIGTL